MKKITAIEIVILFIAGLIPLLWLRDGYFISNGDDFPLFLNTKGTLNSLTNMWSTNNLGYATPSPAYALYQYFGVFLSSLGLSVGSAQIAIQTILLLVGSFSMYYFTTVVYPNHKRAPFIAAFFYIFNIFALSNRHNIGFVWIYAFIPLLLALFIKVINSAYDGSKATNKNIIYFAFVSVIAFSFAGINPANIALILIGITILAIFYVIKYRAQLLKLCKTFGKIAAVTIPINIWWIIPIINYYVLSAQTFNSAINVGAWSWTQNRSSFLNLFWLNGFWGWLFPHVPQSVLDFYSNPVWVILVFAPFLLAASALLFKSGKSRFNAFIMGAILVLVFLAKGLHEPFGQLNLLFYQTIPGMAMFREPVSKFTLLIVPFLALLVGFSAERIMNVKLLKFNFRLGRILIAAVLILIFIMTVEPLVISPIETAESSISSYVKIPDDWYKATSWINSQQGDWKVLITPLDDYYQMNYTSWGYYGTDQLVEALFEKPIVSTSSLDGYKINKDTALNLQELKNSIRGNRSSEFRAMLDLLNVKYIFQRNDLETGMAMPNRYLMSPTEMQNFFDKQPYLRLVEKFGLIDVYEYTESKPSLYSLSPSALEKTDIKIETNNTLEKEWNFTSVNDVMDWHNSTLSNQSQATCEVKQVDGYLEAEMWNLTSSWITVDSPLLPAKYDDEYKIGINLNGTNTWDVQIQIAEYAADKSIIVENATSVKVWNGTFTSTSISFSFELQNPLTQYFSIQIWNYFKSNETAQSILQLGNVAVSSQTTTLHMVGIENVFVNTTQNQTASILQVQENSPMKMVVTVNASEHFILATSQVLDKFWVAYVNGERVKPVSLFLGLQGFPINETGQLAVTIEYEPQLWFYYASAISICSTTVICAFYVYIKRDRIKIFFSNKVRRRSNE